MTRSYAVVKGLLPVVVGGALTASALIANTCLQARSAARQTVVERKLDAIRRYSTACNRRVFLSRRALDLAELGKFLTLSIDRAPVQPSAAESLQIFDSIMRQMESMNTDNENARVEHQAEIDFANALFGTQIPTPTQEAPSRLPTTLLELQKLRDTNMQETREAIPRFAKECADATKLLTGKLAE